MEKNKFGKAANIISTIIVIGAILVFLKMCNSILNTDVPENKGAVKLDVEAYVDNSQLIISNSDSFDYIKVEITINDTYKKKLHLISKFNEVSIPLNDFADKKGNRFSSFLKVQNVSITCTFKDGGYGYYNGSWH